MKRAANARLVLVTCGSAAEARKITRAVVGKRLAACVNVLPEVQSTYRWRGKVERSRELLLVIKTTRARLRRLEEEIRRLHSYEVPEFLVLEVEKGSPAYLRWLGENARNP
jgi:periplasmic divalent cation tolerance protein